VLHNRLVSPCAMWCCEQHICSCHYWPASDCFWWFDCAALFFCNMASNIGNVNEIEDFKVSPFLNQTLPSLKRLSTLLILCNNIWTVAFSLWGISNFWRPFQQLSIHYKMQIWRKRSSSMKLDQANCLFFNFNIICDSLSLVFCVIWRLNLFIILSF